MNSKMGSHRYFDLKFSGSSQFLCIFMWCANEKNLRGAVSGLVEMGWSYSGALLGGGFLWPSLKCPSSPMYVVIRPSETWPILCSAPCPLKVDGPQKRQALVVEWATAECRRHHVTGCQNLAPVSRTCRRNRRKR